MKLPIAFVCLNLAVALWSFWSPALGAESDQGVLEIQIKDYREAIDDFAKLSIPIDQLLISPGSCFGKPVGKS